jgi:isopentenyl phosphate kinase
MSILDQIKMEFKFTGFEPYSVGFEDSNIKQNNYEVSITFKGRKVKFPYAFGITNLQGLTSKVIENMFKLDILAKIVIDCYPPQTFEEFKKEFKRDEMKDDFLESSYKDIMAHSEKLRSLFSDDDLTKMKTALSHWFEAHPNEASALGMKIKN